MVLQYMNISCEGLNWVSLDLGLENSGFLFSPVDHECSGDYPLLYTKFWRKEFRLFLPPRNNPRLALKIIGIFLSRLERLIVES